MASIYGASFTSLYRLFLRSTSASVLDHRQSTRNLRRLYKTEFKNASNAIKQLERAKDERARQSAETWLKEWNARIDRTMEFLYNSSICRGQPHKLTRNLAFFVLGYRQRLRSIQTKKWYPNLPPRSPVYQPPSPPRPVTQASQRKKEASAALKAAAFNALDEVVKMAEGRSKIFLGRISHTKPPKLSTTPKNQPPPAPPAPPAFPSPPKKQHSQRTAPPTQVKKSGPRKSFGLR